MAFTWGGTALKVIRETYNPPTPETTIVEMQLAPDPANISELSSVIQQQGRKREKVTANLLSYDYADYTTLKADMYAMTVRTFVGADGYSSDMVILSISPAVRKLFPTRFEYTVTWLEATA